MIHRVQESSIRVPTGIEGHRTVCKKWQGGRRNHHSHRLAQHPFLVTPVSKCLFIQLYGDTPTCLLLYQHHRVPRRCLGRREHLQS